MRYLVPILAVVLLLVVSCTTVTDLEKPANVSYTVLTNGDGVNVEWDQVTNAEGYYIYLDGNKLDSTTSGTATDIDVKTPGKKITVTAFKGNDESPESDAITTEAVLTTGLVTVYGMGDPDNNVCAIGFNTSGQCLAYDVTDPTKYSSINYVIEDDGVPLGFWSPHHYPTMGNNQHNGASEATTTVLDSLKIAPGAGNYNTQTNMTQNGVYSFWIDPTNNLWSTDDHYAKVRVEGVAGHQVTLKVVYQPIGGLRWLLTD